MRASQLFLGKFKKKSGRFQIKEISEYGDFRTTKEMTGHSLPTLRHGIFPGRDIHARRLNRRTR